MAAIHFTVLGEPQGKGRPRFARRGKFISTYTPEATVVYENLIRTEYERQCGAVRFPDNEPLSVKILAFYGIPQSASKKKRQDMADGVLRPIKKVDCDNLIKVYLDSLNGFAYKDDVQVVECIISKYYSEKPRVEFYMEAINERVRN